LVLTILNTAITLHDQLFQSYVDAQSLRNFKLGKSEFNKTVPIICSLAKLNATVYKLLTHLHWTPRVQTVC